MKNSFLNKIWTIWVSDYTVQTNKCVSNVSEINQSCVVWSSEWVCYSISEQHTNILEEWRESWKADQENSKKISREKSLS